MVLKLLKYAMRLTATTALIGSLTYYYHHDIDKVVNDIKFYLNNSEHGFVPREQSFDLKISRELNGKANLETYVENYSQKLPVLIRQQGIMLGTPEYNYSNFTEAERDLLCKSYPKSQKTKIEFPKKKEDPIKRTLKRLYELIK